MDSYNESAESSATSELAVDILPSTIPSAVELEGFLKSTATNC